MTAVAVTASGRRGNVIPLRNLRIAELPRPRRRLVAKVVSETQTLLDAIALELGQARIDRSALEARTIAAERGLETAIRCADTAGAAVAGGLDEIRQLEARQAMTEKAIERIYTLVDTLAAHFVGIPNTKLVVDGQLIEVEGPVYQ